MFVSHGVEKSNNSSPSFRRKRAAFFGFFLSQRSETNDHVLPFWERLGKCCLQSVPSSVKISRTKMTIICWERFFSHVNFLCKSGSFFPCQVWSSLFLFRNHENYPRELTSFSTLRDNVIFTKCLDTGIFWFGHEGVLLHLS